MSTRRKKLSIIFDKKDLEDAAEELSFLLKRLFPKWKIDITDEKKCCNSDAIYLTKELPSFISHKKKLFKKDYDSYIIQTYKSKGKKRLLIAGNSRRAVFYGIYQFLHKEFNVFYDFHKDIYPKEISRKDILPEKISIAETSSNKVRSYKPQILGNYSNLHSCWSWDLKRWERLIEWCIRQRYNTIHILLFSQANWIRYKYSPEARENSDPYMNTEERICMLKQIIEKCHFYGLKLLIGYYSNGTTFSYVKHYPEQESTTATRRCYQGYLCWHKGHKHLLSSAKEIIDTYSEADGFVIWPHERLCECKKCITGAPFLKIIKETKEYINSHYKGKEFYLLDWHFPGDFIFIEKYFSDLLPLCNGIINVHGGTKRIETYLKYGFPIIHQGCVANWDGSNCTTISPNLSEMSFCAKILNGFAEGFEAHHVSMFSGEYTIDAYGDLIWNPSAFYEELYRKQYINAVYGKDCSSTIETIYKLLESLWTAPFHSYCYLPLYDQIDEGLLGNQAIGGINYHYETTNQNFQLEVGGHADKMTARNLLQMAKSTMFEASHLVSTLKGKNSEIKFLKLSIKIQFQYLKWIENKYNALLLLENSINSARKKNWECAEDLIKIAIDVFNEGSESLDKAGEIANAHPEYFHIIRGISYRGSECQISDFGINIRKKKFYKATISPKALDNKNYGREGYKLMLKNAKRAILKRKVPNY